MGAFYKYACHLLTSSKVACFKYQLHVIIYLVSKPVLQVILGAREQNGL